MSGRSPTHAGAWTPWVPSVVPGGRATLGTSSSSCAESVSKAKLSPKRSQLCTVLYGRVLDHTAEVAIPWTREYSSATRGTSARHYERVV